MPGVVKSIAYFALPSTLDGRSRRGTEVRRRVKVPGSLSAGLVGTGCVAAERASSPKELLRPDAAWVTRDPLAVHSETGAPHRCAAAASNISLAAAPATRMPNSPVPRTAVEPPVTMSPNHSVSL